MKISFQNGKQLNKCKNTKKTMKKYDMLGA